MVFVHDENAQVMLIKIKKILMFFIVLKFKVVSNRRNHSEKGGLLYLGSVHIVWIGLENDGIWVGLAINIINGKIPAAFYFTRLFHVKCRAQVKAVISSQPLAIPVAVGIHW